LAGRWDGIRLTRVQGLSRR